MERMPYRFQMRNVCLTAAHVVSQPKPSVKPHASEAMAKSSLVTSSRTKCGLSGKGMRNQGKQLMLVLLLPAFGGGDAP